MIYRFKRRSGKYLVIDVTIDQAKIARHMADKLAKSGKAKATASSGAIIATVQQAT